MRRLSIVTVHFHSVLLVILLISITSASVDVDSWPEKFTNDTLTSPNSRELRRWNLLRLRGCNLLQSRMKQNGFEVRMENKFLNRIRSARPTCKCEPTSSGFGVVLICEAPRFCSPDGTICGNVTTSVGVDLIDGGLTSARMCIKDFLSPLAAFNIPIVCAGLDINPVLRQVYKKLCPNGLLNCFEQGTFTNNDGEDIEYLTFKNISDKPLNIIEGCEISAVGRNCTYCNACDDQGGISFDCNNFFPGLQYDACLPLRPMLSIFKDYTFTLPNMIIENKIRRRSGNRK